MTTLPFVISTEAYPDFLLRAAGNDHHAVFLKENRMMVRLSFEPGVSAVSWSIVPMALE